MIAFIGKCNVKQSDECGPKGLKGGNQLAVRDDLALEILAAKIVSVLIAPSSASDTRNEERSCAHLRHYREKHIRDDTRMIEEKAP